MTPDHDLDRAGKSVESGVVRVRSHVSAGAGVDRVANSRSGAGMADQCWSSGNDSAANQATNAENFHQAIGQPVGSAAFFRLSTGSP